MVRSVLTFGVYHINKHKVKDLRVIPCYHFGSEKLKESPNKVELVGDVKYCFRKDWGGLVNIWGGGVYVVTNECVYEAGEDMGEISIFLT